MDKIVKWVDTEHKIIKFQNDELIYDISDKVAELNFEKLGLLGGAKAEIKVDTSEGTNGTVVFIKAKEEAPKAKPQETVSTNANIRTVAFIHWKNKAVIFDDEDKVWYTLDPTALAYVKEHKISKGTKVTFESESKGKGNDTITKISTVGTGKENSEKVVNQFDHPRNDVQKSIESQAAVNSANSTIAKLFSGKFDANNSEDGVKVKELVTFLALHNFDLIQTLKNRQNNQ